MGSDHYQTLGLRRDATTAEVKATFCRGALHDHPDHHAHSPDAAMRATFASPPTRTGLQGPLRRPPPR
uniref:J domain-containing protein n=1 Tax=Oryza barthii TaxID=65489 RepID=A0A0D3HL45_9ORYZ